jgi:chemotaxis protein methyltransferase CheR
MELGVPPLSGGQFAQIGELLHRQCGIALAPGKEALVTARLYKRLRTLGLATFEEYLDRVDRDREELRAMVDALTTNKTEFFRERDHFVYMRQSILPELAATSEPIRIWSAGCSSGEEPYSIAMTLREELPLPDLREVRILATDISDRVLASAREGVYDEEVVRDVPPHYLAKYFHHRSGRYVVNDAVRRHVAFARLNLLGEWPMRGPFDAILCRNVMIYFDNATRQQLVERFWDLLKPGGHFFVGGSESLTSVEHAFTYVQPAVFRK